MPTTSTRSKTGGSSAKKKAPTAKSVKSKTAGAAKKGVGNGAAAKKTATTSSQRTAPVKSTAPVRRKKASSKGIFAKAADAVIEVFQGAVSGAAAGAVEGAVISGAKAIGEEPAIKKAAAKANSPRK